MQPQDLEAGLRALQELPRLAVLDIEGRPLTLTAMCAVGAFAQLTSLNVCYTRICDDGVRQIARLRRLRRLHARSCPNIPPRCILLRHLQMLP